MRTSTGKVNPSEVRTVIARCSKSACSLVRRLSAWAAVKRMIVVFVETEVIWYARVLTGYLPGGRGSARTPFSPGRARSTGWSPSSTVRSSVGSVPKLLFRTATVADSTSVAFTISTLKSAVFTRYLPGVSTLL